MDNKDHFGSNRKTETLAHENVNSLGTLHHDSQ